MAYFLFLAVEIAFALFIFIAVDLSLRIAFVKDVKRALARGVST
jgi:hypothetical protein